MPLPGGPSDKAGNSYERRWTVLKLAELIEGTAESIRVEVPGDQGEGAEFRLVKDGIAEWHQAKRQRSGGPWTVAALGHEKVLDPWWPKLATGERCAFVSMTGAQELAEVVERATEAESWQEFEKEFLKAEEVRRHFQTIRRRWGDPPEEAVFEALGRVTVHLIGESELAQWVEHRLSPLLTGRPATAAAVLGQMVDDLRHRELTADDVWSYLGNHGIRPRGLATDADLRRRLADLVDRHLRRLRPLYVGGMELPRPLAGEAFTRLGERRLVVVAGAAGSGKSVFVAQTVQRARAAGWPVMVLSADRFPQAATPEELGRALGLPDAPATVLAGVAAGRESLLVIDQLDAVSTVSGRHPERLALVAEMIAEARSQPSVRVLVACRKFDLDNDRELRAVAVGDENAVVVEPGELGDDDVRAVLDACGMPGAVPPSLQALLRVPLHLAIYVELARRGVPAATAAKSLTDLYDRFWETKRAACRGKRGNGLDEWLDVVDQMVREMSERQELAVPVSRYDHLDKQVKAMASEGVVVADDARLSFFHETFFDYCFARRYLGTGGSLRALLSSVEQDLFRRAQVRQLLVYERTADRPAYLSDLRWLLSAPDVRLHLKALTVAVLETVTDPTPEEWNSVRPIAADGSNALHDRVWQSLRRNPNWFPVLDNAGEWESWLRSSEDAQVEDAVWALSGMAAQHPDRVAALVSAVPLGEERLRQFLRMAEVDAGRPLFDLLLRAVDDGLYDGDRYSDLWYTGQDVAADHPEWAVELIAALLRRSLTLAEEAGEPNPFALTGPLGKSHQSIADDVIEAAAHGAPKAFVEILLPLMIEITRRNERHDAGAEAELTEDAVWSTRFYGSRMDVAADLFHGMEDALRTVAASEPAYARGVLDQLRESRLEAACYLAARAYLGDPGTYAAEVAEWLSEERGALRLGYTNAPYWASRELIAAVVPHLTDEQVAALVDALLFYATKWERSADGRRARGYSELALLNAIPPGRQPARVIRRVGELSRKFNRGDVEPPTGFMGGGVPPPIPEEKAAKMSDVQWLRAIARHGGSQVRFTADGRLIGDAYAQSSVLGILTARQPERFARLLLQMSAGTAQPYIDAVLRGLAGARLDPQLLLAVCCHAEMIGAPEALHWIAWLVEAESAARLPDELIALVARIATEAPDPPADDAVGDVDAAGMNSTRGTAALALGRLVYDEVERLAALSAALRSACRDRSMQVRAMAVRALLFVLPVAEDAAVDLFLVAVEDATNDLLASSNVDAFLNDTIRRGRYADVAGLLARMRESGSEFVRRTAARQSTVASYLDAALDAVVDEAFVADAATRAAVAGVYATNVVHPERRERTFDMLGRALSDDSQQVREAAVRAFYALKDQRLDDFVPLFEHLLSSPALVEHAGPVFGIVEDSRYPLPSVALDVCERFVDTHRGGVGGNRTAVAREAMHVVRIVLRLHAQHSDTVVRRRCLDLIDSLVAAEAHNIEKDLAAMDR